MKKFTNTDFSTKKENNKTVFTIEDKSLKELLDDVAHTIVVMSSDADKGIALKGLNALHNIASMLNIELKNDLAIKTKSCILSHQNESYDNIERNINKDDDKDTFVIYSDLLMKYYYIDHNIKDEDVKIEKTEEVLTDIFDKLKRYEVESYVYDYTNEKFYISFGDAILDGKNVSDITSLYLEYEIDSLYYEVEFGKSNRRGTLASFDVKNAITLYLMEFSNGGYIDILTNELGYSKKQVDGLPYTDIYDIISDYIYDNDELEESYLNNETFKKNILNMDAESVINPIDITYFKEMILK